MNPTAEPPRPEPDAAELYRRITDGLKILKHCQPPGIHEPARNPEPRTAAEIPDGPTAPHDRQDTPHRITSPRHSAEELTAEEQAAIIRAATETAQLNDKFTAKDIRDTLRRFIEMDGNPDGLKNKALLSTTGTTAEAINETIINTGQYGYFNRGASIVFCNPEYLIVRERHNHPRPKGGGTRARDQEQNRRNKERHAAAMLKYWRNLESKQAEREQAAERERTAEERPQDPET